MAFDHYPPTPAVYPLTPSPPGTRGTDVQSWDWVSQLWKSLDEVAAAASNTFHPPTTTIWGGGVIETLTTTVLTDTAQNWAIYRADLSDTVKRWVGWPLTIPTYVEPTSFDVVLLKLFDGGQWDWEQMLRIPITDQNWITGGPSPVSNELIFDAIDTDTPDFPGLDYYTHYFIISRQGSFVQDRVPEWPNDLTLEWATAISTTTSSITVSKTKRGWGNDQWVGKFVYFTAGGKVRNAQITGNNRNGGGDLVLHFSALGTAPDVDVLGILPADGMYWRPSHQPQVPDNEISSTKVMPILAWNRFEPMVDGFKSHFPDGNVSTMNFPASSFVIENVIDPDHNMIVDTAGGPLATDFDQDTITAGLGIFTPPDTALSPDYHKTYRSIQQSLMQNCGNFIAYNADFYDGWDRPVIPNMSLAEFMWHSQVNAAKGTTGNIVYAGDGTTVLGIEASLTFSEAIESGQVPIEGAMTLVQVTHWWFGDADELLPDGDPTNDIWRSRTATTDKGAQLVIGNATWDGSKLSGPGFTKQHENQEVYFTWGCTRLIPNRFRHFYDKECFIPDETTAAPGDPPLEGPQPPAIPPTDWNPGNWTTRPASSNLIDYDEHGKALPPLSGIEHNSEEFATGMLARYVGDNFDDPTTPYTAETTPDWLVTYYDKFYEGKTVDQGRLGPRNLDIESGTVTAGDDGLQFTDASKNWWDGILIGASGEASHTGNFSGNTTTITDSSKSASHFWDNSTTGRWVDHWVQIMQPGAIGSGGTAGALHLASRPITAYNHSTQTITFPAITGLASTYTYHDSGNASHTGNTTYRIREPEWEKNKWAGAVCELTRLDTGDVLTGNITHSENNRIRVDDWGITYTPQAGDTYTIKRVSTGTVWKWGGSEWVKPSGNDTRTSGNVPFPDAQWTIPPTYRRRYGRVMNNDYIGIKFHTEIFQMRSALRMVKISDLTLTPLPDRDAVDPGDGSADNNPSWLDPTGADTCPPFGPTDTSSWGSSAHPVMDSSLPSICTLTASRFFGYAQATIPAGPLGNFMPDSAIRLRLPVDGKFINFAMMTESDLDDGFVSSPYTYNFKDAGDPVAFRKWTSWSTFSGNTAYKQTSAQFGSDDVPDAPPDTTTIYSYYVKEAALILDYGPHMTFIGAPPI